jgi:uncharacterized protein (TIGR02246 family)
LAFVDGSDVDALRRSYDALNEGDLEACLAVLAPDAVWRESPELPGATEVRGREEIRRFLDEFLEPWAEIHQEIEDARVEGERIALLIRLNAVGRESGVEVTTRYAHVWTFRNGQGVEVDAYRDQEDALAALRAGPEARTP